ncbi:MAG: hypothetical protein WCV67_01395 [Victivallaceae bacterium]
MRMIKCSQIYRLFPMSIMLVLLAGCRTSEVKINPDLSFAKCEYIYYVIAINDEYSLHDHNKGYDGGVSFFSLDLMRCLSNLCPKKGRLNVEYLEYDTKMESAIPVAPKLKDAATIQELLNQLRLKHDPKDTGELLLCVVLCDVGWGMPEMVGHFNGLNSTFLKRVQIFIYDIKTQKLWLKSDYQKHLSYTYGTEWEDHILNPIEQFVADKTAGGRFVPEQDGYVLFRGGLSGRNAANK